jgi:subtilisin family serine protease
MKRSFRFPKHSLAPSLALTVLLVAWTSPAFAQAKKKVTKADDLPPITYPVEGTATELVTSAKKFEPFARQVRANIERILAEYEIEDKSTLKEFKGTLLAMELLAGNRTSFTTFGKNVEVYANGFEVDSYIPGGDRMKFSGTSMASPNVANLAAKIIAMKPSLKPSEVVALIKQGAEKGGNENFTLIHPKKAGEMVKR